MVNYSYIGTYIDFIRHNILHIQSDSFVSLKGYIFNRRRVILLICLSFMNKYIIKKITIHCVFVPLKL